MTWTVTPLASNSGTTSPAVTSSTITPTLTFTVAVLQATFGANLGAVSGARPTWTNVGNNHVGNRGLYVWVGTGSPSTANVTFTQNGSDTWNGWGFSIFDVSGGSGSDVSAQRTNSETIVLDSGSFVMTTTYPNGATGAGNLAVGVYGPQGGAPTWGSERAGWTGIHSVNSGGAGSQGLHTNYRAGSDTKAGVTITNANFAGGAALTLEFVALAASGFFTNSNLLNGLGAAGPFFQNPLG